MLKNNLKIASRRLLKNKKHSAILISGLAIGMAACILLLQYVSYELSFDQFHAKSDNIYRVINERIQSGTTVQKGSITYPTIGPTMKSEFPEVKNATRMAYSSDVMIIKADNVSPVEPALWVDEHFFEIFDFEILAGNPLSLLDETNEIILTKSLADKYFPAAKDNYNLVINEELRIDRYAEKFKVVGVCEDVPKNSHLEFEMLLSYASCLRYWGEAADNSWQWSDFYHYLELEPNTDAKALESKFTDFSQRHFKGAEISGSEEIFTLQALSDIHLNSKNLEYEIVRTNNGRAIWSLLIIAFLILFIAWINYVNLSSVSAIERAKEVGVRKVVGATKQQLILQFLAEAALVNVISLVLAVLLVESTIPWFSNYFALETSTLSVFNFENFNPYLFLGLLGLIIAGIIVSGIYPAFLLSATRMSNVLKGVFSKDIGGASMRKSLVVFQFTMSIGLIVGAWMVARQINFMSDQQLGINIDQVITVNSPEMSSWDSTFIERMNTFQTELTKIPGVTNASSSARAPGQRMAREFNIRKMSDGAGAQNYSSNIIQVDYNYANTYGIKPVAGRFFRATDHSNDVNEIDKIILNETAAKMMGYLDPKLAVNQALKIDDKQWNVIGVMPDFHHQSLHHPIEPILFTPFYSTFNQLSLKLSTGGQLDKTIASIKGVYVDFFPGNNFEYHFVDERFQTLYEADVRFGRVLSFFTLLTMIIACLGLFGLASYMTFLRTKEIGIRKVLGASVTGIVALLSKDFLKLVVLSIIVATPLAYLFLDQWLADFAYRIDIPWWIFIVAGLVAITLAF